jgi:RNA polymerase sigma-70 factor (ECF subfamily)
VSARDAAGRRVPCDRDPGPARTGTVIEVEIATQIRQLDEGGHPYGGRQDAGEDDAGLVMRAVGRAKGGDESALHFLYLRYREDVRRYVDSIVRDHHDTEDVTQSVFLKLASMIHGYEPRGVPFAAWLIRVARNAAVDCLRARRMIPFEEVRVTDNGRDQAMLEQRESLKKALDRLPDDQREVVILRYVAGLQPRDIAEVLRKSHSAVHGLQHRGRRAMKAALEEMDTKPLTA